VIAVFGSSYSWHLAGGSWQQAAAGTFSFTLKVTDSAGDQATKTGIVTIAP
jgi:hypothetical protein